MENGKIGGIRIPKPLNRFNKMWHGWLSRRYDPACQNSHRSPHWGALRKWWNITLAWFLVFSFLWPQILLAFGTKPDNWFLRCLIHRMSVQGCCIPRGIKVQNVWFFPIFTLKYKQNGHEYAFSSLTLKRVKVAYYRNYTAPIPPKFCTATKTKYFLWMVQTGV